jgi:hypothetical protein
MLLWGQRTRSSRWSDAHPGSPGEPDAGQRGLDIPGTERASGRALGSQNQRQEVCAKMLM